MVAAREQRIPIVPRAVMLADLMRLRQGIAVAGTHGKSTSSAWLTYVLEQAGLEPSFIVGADIPQLGGSSGAGNGKFFVAEACEYDRSFLNLHPKIAVILNVEADHLDYYKDEEEIVGAFCEFAHGVTVNGMVVVNGEDANVARVIASLPTGQVRLAKVIVVASIPALHRTMRPKA